MQVLLTLLSVVATTTTTAYPLAPPHHLFMNCNNPICSTNGMYGFHCKNGLCSYVCSEAGCRFERLDFRPQPFNVIFCGCENPSCSMDGFHGYGCAHGACHYICSEYGCVDVTKKPGIPKRPKKAQARGGKKDEDGVVDDRDMMVSTTTSAPVTISTQPDVVTESTVTLPAKEDLNKTDEIKEEKKPRRMRRRLLKKRPKRLGKRIKEANTPGPKVNDTTNHIPEETKSEVRAEKTKKELKDWILDKQGVERESKSDKTEEKALPEENKTSTENPQLTTSQTETLLEETEAEPQKSTVQPQQENQTRELERRRRRKRKLMSRQSLPRPKRQK